MCCHSLPDQTIILPIPTLFSCPLTRKIILSNLVMETIEGNEAIRRIREISKGGYFSIMFYTCDRKREEGGELRKYNKCRVRPAEYNELAETNPDHFLYFTDIESGEARRCWKKLIRFVGFAPEYNMMKIDWYK